MALSKSYWQWRKNVFWKFVFKLIVNIFKPIRFSWLFLRYFVSVMCAFRIYIIYVHLDNTKYARNWPTCVDIY